MRPTSNPLTSFGSELDVAVIGANGGIGQAFVKYFNALPSVKNVWALSRTSPNELNKDTSLKKCSWIKLDLDNEQSILEASNLLKDHCNIIHIVVVAVGILHNDKGVFPEKTWRSLAHSSFETVFRANTFGPGLAAKYFLPLLAKEQKSVFALLSARVGSISDNRKGGWYSYRASKAALNMLIRGFAIELAYRNRSGICIGLHPGTVNTTLSAPFQSNLQPDVLFEPDQSVKKMVEVLDKVNNADSGFVYSWDGQQILP